MATVTAPTILEARAGFGGQSYAALESLQQPGSESLEQKVKKRSIEYNLFRPSTSPQETPC
eukprot:1763776-Amphidinium_carterae.2